MVRFIKCVKVRYKLHMIAQRLAKLEALNNKRLRQLRMPA